jgi:tetratricopeptide (TPR) repeat protein/predicted Ser/Thr protein kinase
MRSHATSNAPALPVSQFVQLDAVCDRFEAAWRSGRRPDLASYLSEAPAGVKVPLFRNLLNLDIEYRRQRGEQPEAQSYHGLFPELRDVVDAAFRARAQGSGASSMSQGDPVVRTGRTQVVKDSTAATAPQVAFGPGATVDLTEAGYEVLGELGLGGMGVVYKAHQVALNRVVALKLIKAGTFASEAERVRFQNEAEAVAQLDHPHIIPIYEVGTLRGQHFFSMKLISGTGLDKRLADYAANPRAAARLVAVTAEAIHHAHQCGILHRDLKPANILLDERGEPYVTDFGLAKRLDAPTELTHSGLLMGTPSYMAPEQATQSRRSLSTATDVYGLGTILYALLAGRAPFAGTTLVETLDLVRSHSPEPPSKVNPRVPRDLEIICLKCLEKEPDRRYPGALALAEDLQRWRTGQPIQARPVGPMTRAAMWCRRNPALATLAALLVLALAAGFAGVTWKWREANGQRIKAEAVNKFLIHGLLAQASPEFDPLARNRTVRELLDRAVDEGAWLDLKPEIEAMVRETIGGAYLELGQHDKAKAHLRTAIRLDTQLSGPRHRDTLRATNLWATLLDRTNRGAEAEPLLRRNLDDCRRSLGPDDPITLDAAERLGSLLRHLGKGDEAESVLRKNVDDRRRVLQPEHPDTLRSIYLLSRLLLERGQLADAEKHAYQYAHSIQCARGSNHPDNVLALTNQGDVFRAQGKLDQAERYYRHAAIEARRIFGPEHPDTLTAEQILERVLRAKGGSPGHP